MIISEKVPLFTPIEGGNCVISFSTNYLNPIFGEREVAVLQNPLRMDEGSFGCTRKNLESDCSMTAIKVATYFLSLGTVPLLAILTTAIYRYFNDYHYIEASLFEGPREIGPAKQAALSRLEQARKQEQDLELEKLIVEAVNSGLLKKSVEEHKASIRGLTPRRKVAIILTLKKALAENQEEILEVRNDQTSELSSQCSDISRHSDEMEVEPEKEHMSSDEEEVFFEILRHNQEREIRAAAAEKRLAVQKDQASLDRLEDVG
jgi:hypothetical protein